MKRLIIALVAVALASSGFTYANVLRKNLLFYKRFYRTKKEKEEKVGFNEHCAHCELITKP